VRRTHKGERIPRRGVDVDVEGRHRNMDRILAIESDPKRANLLTSLVRAHVNADLEIVGTVADAIESLHEQTPDLILAPTLLSPQDSGDLMDHVRGRHAPWLQILTVSALDMLTDRRPDMKVRTSFFRRRPVQLGLQYDPGMVATQIKDALERARTVRLETEAALAHADYLASLTTEKIEIASPAALHQITRKLEAPEERRREERKGPGAVPWLAGIRTPFGLDLHLMNISSTGLLVESSSKLTPGVSCDLELCGLGTALPVRARFLRSDVGQISGLGVRYYSAAQFDRELDLLRGQTRPLSRGGATLQQGLADLVAAVLTQKDPVESARTRFTRGVRQLVDARDVIIRSAPVAPADGSESIFFQVQGEAKPPAVLQVLFDPNHVLTAAEFNLLKAAASLTSAVLDIEKPYSN
jgi:CheY-like chemotaxis protein